MIRVARQYSTAFDPAHDSTPKHQSPKTILPLQPIPHPPHPQYQRINQAAREAGADASFVEAPESLDQMNQIGRRAPRPMVANMIENGRTPVLSRQQLADMGFALILYPLAGLFAAARALQDVYTKLHRDHTTQGAHDRLMTFPDFNALIGVEAKYQLAERWGEVAMGRAHALAEAQPERSDQPSGECGA